MPMDNPWLAGLRRGDAEAYEQLVERFESPLYRYFLASHGDPQLAGEQSADCFAELVSALPKMRGGSEQLRSFIFAVARNVLRRHWRRSGGDFVSLDTVHDAIDSAPPPEATAESREQLARVFRALRELDASTREVFVLRYVEQLSLAEVAAVTGEPLGTTKSRIHRGRQKLKKLLRIAEKT